VREIVFAIGYRWEGYQRKWRSVWPELRRALEDAGGRSLAPFLEGIHEDATLRRALRVRLAVTVSRLFRGRRSFETLMRLLDATLPAQGEARVWSAGCASGEEACTLAMFWGESIRPLRPDLRLRIIGTDVRGECLDRARRALYPPGAARNVPPSLLERYFDSTPGGLRFRMPENVAATFVHSDLLEDPPPQECTIALCRSLAFTYFGPDGQRTACRALARAVVPGGFLVIGDRETLPAQEGFEPIPEDRTIFRRAGEKPAPEWPARP
jgi:chemotaxis protein methyltransferase CheR